MIEEVSNEAGVEQEKSEQPTAKPKRRRFIFFICLGVVFLISRLLTKAFAPESKICAGINSGKSTVQVPNVESCTSSENKILAWLDPMLGWGTEVYDTLALIGFLLTFATIGAFILAMIIPMKGTGKWRWRTRFYIR